MTCARTEHEMFILPDQMASHPLLWTIRGFRLACSAIFVQPLVPRFWHGIISYARYLLIVYQAPNEGSYSLTLLDFCFRSGFQLLSNII